MLLLLILPLCLSQLQVETIEWPALLFITHIGPRLLFLISLYHIISFCSRDIDPFLLSLPLPHLDLISMAIFAGQLF